MILSAIHSVITYTAVTASQLLFDLLLVLCKVTAEHLKHQPILGGRIQLVKRLLVQGLSDRTQHVSTAAYLANNSRR